jgi:hypothetical protein
VLDVPILAIEFDWEQSGIVGWMGYDGTDQKRDKAHQVCESLLH